MTIGFDIRTLMDKYYSGVSIYTLNLLKAILEQDSVNSYKLFYNSYKNTGVNIPEFNFANAQKIKTSYPNKILNYIMFNIFKMPKIDKNLHSDFFFMPHINFISLKRPEKNIVVVHDLSFLHYPYFFTKRQNFWHQALKIKKLLRSCACIISVSENTKKDIMHFYGIPEKKIKVIYSGIEEIYKPIDRTDSHFLKIKQKYNLPDEFILHLGNIEPRKNIESVLEAYVIFRKKNPHKNTKLVIAGNMAWKNRVVKTIAKNCPYQNDILFLGYVEREEKPYLYNLAKLFVFPSFYEGFGFPPLEAAACGTPVIVSNTSSLPEILGSSAILINPHDVNELARAFSQVLNSEALQEKLRQDGLKNASHYNWSKTAKQVIEVFNEVGQ